MSPQVNLTDENRQSVVLALQYERSDRRRKNGHTPNSTVRIDQLVGYFKENCRIHLSHDDLKLVRLAVRRYALYHCRNDRMGSMRRYDQLLNEIPK